MIELLRLILNRIAEHVDAKLISEQAGFRPGKSCTSQRLNLAEHIHRRWLREAPDHRCYLRGLVCCLRHGLPPTPPQQGARDDWRRTPDRPDTHHVGKQTLLRGAEREEEPLATTTKRTTTGNCTGTEVVQHLHQRQPVHTDTRSFIYADDLCIASQGNDFNNIEAALTSALSTMPAYYDTNQLRANPSKTLVCAFHLRNREAKRELNVVWNGARLSNTTTPVYLGIRFDRTLCYTMHIEKTNMKVIARNSIIRKFLNSNGGASTLRLSCLALCYSAAEYACPECARSTHARKLNPALHDCCRIISGCLKPTNVDSVNLLAGSPLLTSGGRFPAAWNAHDKRQTQDTNCSITNQRLAD